MSNTLIEQFILESKDYLQRIGEILIALEEEGEDKDLLNELFRLVHTLKGNSGLFDFASMTRLLHASEDLMNLVREGVIPYSSDIADTLLESMDIVSIMIDEIESSEHVSARTNQWAEEKAKHIRDLISEKKKVEIKEEKEEEGEKEVSTNIEQQKHSDKAAIPDSSPSPSLDFMFSFIPESVRILAVKRLLEGEKLILIQYSPESECFYKGEDPLYLARQTPGLIWAKCYLREEIPDPSLMDIYQCVTDFELLSSANKEELSEHFKYVLDQVKFIDLEPTTLIIPEGEKNGGPVYEDFIEDARKYLEENNIEVFKNAIRGLIELSSPKLYFASVLRWIELLVDYLPKTRSIIEALLKSLETMTPPVFSPEKEFEKEPELTKEEKKEEDLELPGELLKIFNTQQIVLEKLKSVKDDLTRANILKSVIASIENGLISLKRHEVLNEFKRLSEQISQENFEPLENWVKAKSGFSLPTEKPEEIVLPEVTASTPAEKLMPEKEASPPEKEASPAHAAKKVLKVDETKIDRLMNLIGEFVVAKNSLPYLAQKVDNFYKIPELSKEIKNQYNILNRISEEMQDAIMQIRMVPVSVVFQRFPRLVRDLSKRLNKKVKLVIEGEETEADKNVIESLSDPLIHIIRNSLDHGIETAEERISKGKPEAGTIILRARHEADHVLIEVMDDGRGMDPEKIKLKAYQKGLITEEQFGKIKDSEAINLIFLPGFSTAESTTDLSGRGVGMDVVKTAVEKFGGSVRIQSAVDKGTTITLSLPLSMAVSHVMIIESAGERFGIPIDAVVETVRISKTKIQTIKGKMTFVLRNKVVPLFYLNDLLEMNKPHITNEEGEYAVVVLSVKGELIGVVVDKFRETADIILKPFTGFLANMRVFSGTAIMGDGSVLLIINPKELVNGGRIHK
jgi:two-component system chemotaxis sensor kinase CheA